jgi:class 3 adenylate cyclase
MLARSRKNWLRYLKGSIALPIFIALSWLIPNLDAEDKIAYPIEAFLSSDSARSIGDIMKLPEGSWRPFKGHGVAALSADPVDLWYRVRIPALRGSPAQRLVAEIGYFLVPQIDFYLADGQTVINHVASGMERLDPKAARKSLFYTFTFDRPQHYEQDLYVRATRGALLLAPIVIRSEERFYASTQIRELFNGLVLGLFIGVFLYNLVLYSSLRDSSYIYFVIYLLCVLVYSLLESGVPAVFSAKIATNYTLVGKIMAGLAIACVLTSVLFVQSFLRLRRNLPVISRQLRYVQYVCIAAAVLINFISIPAGFMLASAILIGSFGYMAIVALANLHLNEVLQFFAAFFGIFVGRLIWFMNEFGFWDASPMLTAFYQLGCVWAALSMITFTVARIESMKGQQDAIVAALEHNAPKHLLNSFLSNSFVDQYNSTEIVVTIMFVDISSFSRISERHEPNIVFENLSKSIEDITKIVYEYGGTIDRSLGDGVLCFFGYEKKAGGARHVSDGFMAAKKIQEMIVDKINNNATDHVPLPVRIGLHSDKVTIGNMGNAKQVDFTMVGNGVNFANRLETACSPFKIMVSESCYQSLLEDGADAGQFSQIFIAVKHQIELVRAYEADPFEKTPDTLNTAMQVHSSQLGMIPKDARYRVSSRHSICLTTSYGKFQVVDFSMQGFRVKGPTFLAQKSIISVDLETGDPVVDAELKARFLHKITVEVRWSRRESMVFEHGMQVLGGGAKQWRYLMDQLISLGKSDDQKGVADGERHTA